MLVCHNWPVGGIMQFTTPVTVEGVPLSISPVVISDPNQMVGLNFTGLQGPWSTTATILWWQGNSAAPSPSSTLEMAVMKIIGVQGQSFTGPPPKAVTAEQMRWPTFVGPDYPHLERRGPVGHQTACKLPHRLAGAHPLPLLPHVGRFDPAKREINMSPIASVIVARDCVYIEKLKNTA
ncbi:hypothetical protein BKA62DRAFT_24048 [Auriculariales sp. MPI-PUGE-AT-0066]|nr:hypothetical protein BKA62DRAFT_24048 [Auriculariales sp. MPI-PUGE-AT-0066]